MTLYFAGAVNLQAFWISVFVLLPVAAGILLYQTVKGLRTAKTTRGKQIYSIFLGYLFIAAILILIPVNTVKSFGVILLLALFWSPILIVPTVLLHMLLKRKDK